MENVRDIDIVIFGLTRFDGPYSSPAISIAKEFSKNNRVFYINHPYSLKDVITGFKRERISSKISPLFFGRKRYKQMSGEGKWGDITMVVHPVSLPINFLSDGGLYRQLQKVNDRIFFSVLRKLIRDKKIKKFIFLNAYNPYFGLNFPDDIEPIVRIYQSMDDMEEEPYTRKHGARLEREFVKEYDITITTSEELLRIHKGNAKSIYCLPNAADPQLFNRAYYEELERPEEFKNTDKKVIGFVGNIESRMDYDLVKKLASAHSDKLVYLIGPQSTNEYRTSGLDKIPNIIFTGGKKIDDLPAYLRYIDSAIIPFRCNKLTKSIYPLKINEYLAAGKPVVTTNFSDAIEAFSEVIYLADSHDEFISLIDKSIEENSHELAKERLAFAQKNSWTDRVEDFWKMFREFESRTN